VWRSSTTDWRLDVQRQNNSAPKPAATPGKASKPATIPAMGITQQDLPDRLRPEVVDIDVLENLGDMPSAAPSDGTGTSGNINSPPPQASLPPSPPSPKSASPLPPQQL
jgi:hypothetical protein